MPHYSISIIRAKIIDENALAYIIDQEQMINLRFRQALRAIMLEGLQDRVHYGKEALRAETTSDGSSTRA
ncbi:cysteine protease StiP domain-containing protein [Paenibacillus terrae]|uniref:cysteine protease StiP domain-containing protein n=1 Tax=Paenibacillus terrae TaxID=159743 RepID=UPI001269ABBE|nr:cysteine protease StiP domain-containing protein [Paenibacillus terrae]